MNTLNTKNDDHLAANDETFEVNFHWSPPKCSADGKSMEMGFDTVESYAAFIKRDAYWKCLEQGVPDQYTVEIRGLEQRLITLTVPETVYRLYEAMNRETGQ